MNDIVYIIQVVLQEINQKYLPPVVCRRDHVLFTSSCLQEGSCFIYVISVCLCIVVSNTYCVVFLFLFVLCSLCCQFLWIVFFFVLCSLCCQFLWIVLFLRLVQPMLPVSLDCLFLRLVQPMLPVSLYCPFLNAPSVFSNVYLL